VASRGCDDAELFWLILDCDTVHREKGVEKFRAELGINHLFISPRLTENLQPFDLSVFGVIKNNYPRVYRPHVPRLSAMNKQMAAGFLIRA
jgi:hypothetical protein